MRLSRFRVLGLTALVAMIGFSASGCSTGQALVSPRTHGDADDAVQREALKAVEGLRIGLEITRQFGAELPSLGLPRAEARAIDCAILKVAGTSKPASRAVVSACGPVPLAPGAPVALALDALSTVSTCSDLHLALATLRPAITALLDAFNASTVAAVRVMDVAIQIAFTALAPGGARC